MKNPFAAVKLLRAVSLWGFAFSVWLGLSACGPSLSGDGDDSPGTPERRLYLNDPAANDSLPSAVVRQGLHFVMQPGESYSLAVSGDHNSDRLSVYYYGSAGLSKYAVVPAVHDDGREFFALSSNRSVPTVFMAQLLLQDGSSASTLDHVALASLGTAEGNSLNVRLIFVRTLRGLSSDASKSAFAEAFFTVLASGLESYGIALNGSYQIIEPQGAAVGYPFGSFVALPGDRVAGHAHMYLVDSITHGEGSNIIGDILAFAPREAADIDMDADSRIVLSRKGGGAATLAVTAAHELGHFFGFRHTTATPADVLSDQDFSNLDDGFAGTPRCPEMEAAAAAAEGTFTGASARTFTRYCVRVALDYCSVSCDLENLMFPYDCRNAGASQNSLTEEQAAFLRKNIAVFSK